MGPRVRVVQLRARSWKSSVTESVTITKAWRLSRSAGSPTAAPAAAASASAAASPARNGAPRMASSAAA